MTTCPCSCPACTRWRNFLYFRDRVLYVTLRTGCFVRLPPIAEQLQQVDEEIQEIQIQVPSGKCVHVLSLFVATNSKQTQKQHRSGAPSEARALVERFPVATCK